MAQQSYKYICFYTTFRYYKILDRKIQLELAPPTPVSEGQEKKNDADTVNVVQNGNISASKGIRI